MITKHLRWVGFVGLGLLAACGSDDDSAGGSTTTGGTVTAPTTLVKSSPDTTCAGGGTKLEFGADKNGNGSLDADEVTTSQIVCAQGGAPTLTTVTPTGPSAKCKNGGVTVKSGPDTNRNGVLDDAEVKETNEICGGGTSTELSKTTVLPAGDVSCPFGGTSTETGVDNGANGSIAGDGVLQAGEVSTTTLVCTSGGTNARPLTPPTGAAGAGTIRTSGGAGSAGAGGTGGAVRIGLSQGSRGGHIKLWKNGKADAAFTVPAETPIFGATKLDVTANKTLVNRSASTEAADGEYYVLNGGGLFFRENAGNPQVAVTGLHVAAGITLTFPATSTSVSLSDDVHNEGTITAGVSPAGDRGDLVLQVAKYIGAAGSKIDLTGAPVAGAAGGKGGNFGIQADRVINASSIDTSGANGDAAGANAGGAAGTVSISAQRTSLAGPLVNTGAIKANGGKGKAAGGGGAAVFLFAATRGVSNSGTIQANGGVGGTNGGSGGQIVLGGFGGTPVRNAAALSSNGGSIDEAACSAACAGGAGKSIQFVAFGGDLINDGDLSAVGGNSENAAGAAGGFVILATINGSDPLTGAVRPAGSIRTSGNLDTRGGNGLSGGMGGVAEILASVGEPRGQEIEVFGLASIDASGGQGTSGGGTAGQVSITNTPSLGTEPSGSVICHAAINAKGGAATTSGAGGNGGNVVLLAGTRTLPQASSQAIVLGGPIDTSGGNGVTIGGVAGAVQAEAAERIDVFGALSALGGNQTGASGGGGPAAPASFRSGGAFTSAQAITLRGGNGAGAGSTGGPCLGVTINATSVSAKGAITCGGGNGTGAAGGNGGTISIAGSAATSSVAAVTAPGGTGTPNGTAGMIVIDGNVQ